ncbi:hypothetical protein F895_00578 [Acinetobacter sp. CIP 64.2]|nr:hypothetical protein F895_00578 [Acinetobacter sp. CIP 64.2]
MKVKNIVDLPKKQSVKQIYCFSILHRINLVYVIKKKDN